jgi:chromosome partitioning protein
MRAVRWPARGIIKPLFRLIVRKLYVQIKFQNRLANRPIPFAVLFTRTNPAILPRTQRFIEERFAELKVPIFATKLYDREAFRAIFSYGGSVAGLKEKGVSNRDAAFKNAHELTAELVERLRNGNKTIVKEVA